MSLTKLFLGGNVANLFYNVVADTLQSKEEKIGRIYALSILLLSGSLSLLLLIAVAGAKIKTVFSTANVILPCKLFAV
jgi:hypothetical protein